MLRVNAIDYSGSIVDGPGIRTVVFLQGCDKRCQGCQNPQTWSHSGGQEMEIADLIDELEVKVSNRKLTISGGEPLLQQDGVVELIKGLHDFNIALYTGFDLEEVPEEIIKNVDYLKVGSYVEAQRSSILPYVGSANQSFLDLRNMESVTNHPGVI